MLRKGGFGNHNIAMDSEPVHYVTVRHAHILGDLILGMQMFILFSRGINPKKGGLNLIWVSIVNQSRIRNLVSALKPYKFRPDH